MRKKIISILTLIILILISMPTNSFAQNSNKGKAIFISVNRTNLDDLLSIPSIKKQLNNRGYIALMNTKGDNGTDDKRSYASMGAAVKSNVPSYDQLNFIQTNAQTKKQYQASTNKKATDIVNLNINSLLEISKEDNDYGATYGLLGQTLVDNNKKISVIGNSDIPSDKNPILNRNIALIAMDKMGRVALGNIENINTKDESMPYQIKTDYTKLENETKRFYNKSDAVFIEIGDTYRLDQYKKYLNDKTYENVKTKIYNNIDSYLNKVFDMASKDDVIYIASPFVPADDYKQNKSLSPILKFEGDKKGILSSLTTKRNGVVSNIDVGADMLNYFGLSNPNMTGKPYYNVSKDDNQKYIKDEYQKIIASFNTRITVGVTFAVIFAIPVVIGILIFILKDKKQSKKLIINISKEFIKFGLAIPLALLIAPLLNFKTTTSITIGICLFSFLLYILGRVIFKADVKYMTAMCLITVVIILIDCVTGTNLMKYAIMSYDPIYGARYYGMGNEYQGIIIGAAIFGIGSLLNYKKIPKYIAILILISILIISSNPMMGANVGAAISESIAFAIFILFAFNIKVDFKKSVFVIFFAALIVALFAFIDMKIGNQSHLASFVKQILVNGQDAIIRTFTRKIQMNIGIAKSNMAINILIIAIFSLGIFLIKPTKHFIEIFKTYPMILKGMIANIIGCAVTLLVNDSGVVSAATASIYIFIPITIIVLNDFINYENK